MSLRQLYDLMNRFSENPTAGTAAANAEALRRFNAYAVARDANADARSDVPDAAKARTQALLGRLDSAVIAGATARSAMTSQRLKPSWQTPDQARQIAEQIVTNQRHAAESALAGAADEATACVAAAAASSAARPFGLILQLRLGQARAR